jgi:hypothetical protein
MLLITQIIYTRSSKRAEETKTIQQEHPQIHTTDKSLNQFIYETPKGLGRVL